MFSTFPVFHIVNGANRKNDKQKVYECLLKKNFFVKLSNKIRICLGSKSAGFRSTFHLKF